MTSPDYYFAHDDLFVIPIEHLSPAGISVAMQHWLGERGRATGGWIALFNDAFRLYRARVAALAARAPQHWFPPRLQHVCVVTAPRRVRPYFQPLNKCSWLLQATDFDPEISTVEFATYQFVHAERMGLLQEVTQTAVWNLAYWLERNDAEIAAFCDGCARSPRPDAAGFRALAEAMPWIRRLHHRTVRPPRVVTPEPPVELAHTGLLMPRAQQPQLDHLVRRWTLAAQSAMEAFHATYARRGRDRAGELCAWLGEHRPSVLVTGGDGRVVWDPERPTEMRAIRAALGGLGEAAANSLRADLAIVAERTRRFLGSLRAPAELPPPHADTAQNGLSYMHVTRRMIAYNLHEPGMERLRVPAPPYERFMLAARTIHEWGHLAVDAGWVPVAAARRAEHEQLSAALADRFEAIHRDAPAAVRTHTAGETARLTRDGTSIGGALARIALARLPDYQANLLARRYLEPAELETYIRNNVYSLALDYPSTALFVRLARYAYEYQYLRLSQVDDPLTYFLDSTWIRDEYLARQIVGEAPLLGLLEAVGALCDCYAVDETQFADAAAWPGHVDERARRGDADAQVKKPGDE